MPNSSSQSSFSQNLLKATRMTGMGRLMDATRLLQKALVKSVAGQGASRAPNPVPADAKRQAGAAVPGYRMPRTAANDTVIDVETKEPVQQPGREAGAPVEALVPRARRATFTKRTFLFDGEHYPYRLYVPAMPGTPEAAGASSAQAAMPLIVLLHGCKQDAQDFAHGTAMNALAEQHGFMVLYPEQISKANSQMCWNWFEPGHQQLGRGEPGMIAALTLHILDSHKESDADKALAVADPSRVYIAGLSAGGAMAAVVAGLYPNVFAALGVHSGLPAGAAQNLLSAFAAMRLGSKGEEVSALPTIVFHGCADKTVHPDNGENISDAAVAALKASGLSLRKQSSVVGDSKAQNAERVTYRGDDGRSYVEHWQVSEGPHAWSGGDAKGSYTDPDGPSASEAMLAFFMQHKK